MVFKAFILCFAIFVVTTSGASVCKCGAEEKKDKVSKYTVKIDDGTKTVDETIEIDTEKETETFHLPSNGDTSPSSPGDVVVIYDFKQNLAMHRVSNRKACFLSNSTENLPKPRDLQKLLEMESSKGRSQAKTQSKARYEYVVVGTIHDRSFLSDEMAALCAKLPIYRVQERGLVVGVEKESHRQRIKRDCRQERSCWELCVLIFCWTSCDEYTECD